MMLSAQLATPALTVDQTAGLISRMARPFLGQDDQDYDGTIDYLLIQVHDEAKNISRGLIFILEGNLFIEDFDSGWADEEEFLGH